MTLSFNRLLPASVLSRQRSRVRARRPRRTFQKSYGTYGPIVTSKSGFDMGAVRVLPPILRVFFILNFTQIWNHHLHNLALCCPLVRVHRLCVDIKRDPAIRVSQELLNGFDILSGVISSETPSCASARRFSG